MELYDEFYDDELYHHGILGMKWGVRRYQNKDGSLTSAGTKRYGSGKSIGERIKDYKTAKTRQKNLKKARAVRVERKKEEERKVKAAEERQKLLKAGKIKTKDMTDEEIANKINRLEQERRLKQLQQETAVYSKGQKFVKTMMDKVVTPAATSAGEQFLRKYLNDVGDDILSGIKDARAKQDPNKRQAAELEKLKNEHSKLTYEKQIADLKKTKTEDYKELERLAMEYDKLNAQKKVNDIKNPKKSTAELVAEAKQNLELQRLLDEELQTSTRNAKVAENYNKIYNPKFDWSSVKEDKDKNINGIDDEEET